MCRLPFTTDHRLQSAFVLKMTDLTVDLLTLHFLVSILSFSWSWYFMAKLALSHGQAHRAQSCFMLRAFLCFAPRGREKKSEGGGTHTHTAVYSSCWAWWTNTVKILTEHTTKQTLEEQGFYGHWYLILWCRAGRTPFPQHNQCASTPHVPHTFDTLMQSWKGPPSMAQSVCIMPASSTHTAIAAHHFFFSWSWGLRCAGWLGKGCGGCWGLTGAMATRCHALWAESGGWQACISAGVHICTREAWSEAPFGLLQQTSPLSHQHFTSTKPTLPPINHNSISKVNISIYSPSTLHIIQHDITITIILKYNNTTNLKVSQEATEMHQI